MPVIYRIVNTAGDKAVFFASKGEGTRAKRDHKKTTKEELELEKLTVRGREQIVALLNDPTSTNSEAEDDEHGLL